MITKTRNKENRSCRTFSNAATQYDQLTRLHQDIGGVLLGKIPREKASLAILDVGMGTGWFTNKLSNTFASSQIMGIDFAPGMVRFAKKKHAHLDVIQADVSALPFKRNVFDIIVSNLALQWAADLEETFQQCYACLKNEGEMHVAMFGYDTLKELFSSLESSLDIRQKHKMASIKRLPDFSSVTNAIKKGGFPKVQTTSQQMEVNYASMRDLMKWTKDIGANALGQPLYLGKDVLSKAADYYQQNFSREDGVYATFEVIWIKGQKK